MLAPRRGEVGQLTPRRALGAAPHDRWPGPHCIAGSHVSGYAAPVPLSPFIAPCIPSLRDRLPTGVGWLYEVKFDGYRMQIHKADDRVVLYTRNGGDWTDRFPGLVADLAKLRCESAIIDAELVHSDGFDALHRTA